MVRYYFHNFHIWDEPYWVKAEKNGLEKNTQFNSGAQKGHLLLNFT